MNISAVWMFLIPLIGILVPIWLGQQIGIRNKQRAVDLHEGSIGSAVAGTLGLFAFMLAFTFQIVGDRFDKRKELFLSEVSDIRTGNLYAGLIPEPYRSSSRKLISNYVDLRVAAMRDVSSFPLMRERSQRILDTLWSYAESLAAEDRSSEAYALFTSSMAKMIQIFNERITVTLQTHLPRTVAIVLSMVGFFSMLALGYQFGISGRVSLVVMLLFGVAFAAVMWLIFALDRPELRLITIDRSAMISLQAQLHSGLTMP